MNYTLNFILVWLAEVGLIISSILIIFLSLKFWGGYLNRYTGVFLALIVLYIIFVSMMFFYIPGRIMLFRPEKDIIPVGAQILLENIQKSFSQKNADGKELFEVYKKNNDIFLTWSNKLDYKQIISFGENRLKRVFIIKLDENSHTAYLSQKDVDWSWGASLNNFSFNLSYFRGISIEFKKLYKPSFILREDGTIVFDIKNIKYSSDEIMQPLLKVLLFNGWIVRCSVF
jgi:hypothetical protein